MAEVRWLVRSGEHVIITAPDAPAGVDAAVGELRGALDGFAGRKPAWFRLLERLGYWWYGVCMAATAAVFVAFAPNGFGMNLAYGLGFGVTVTLVTGMLLTGAAHLQARLANGGGSEATVKRVAPLARPAGDVVEQVEAILAKDPVREREVHLLAWNAAERGRPNRAEALAELDALWALADPAAAAEREAQLRELEETIERLRRRNQR